MVGPEVQAVQRGTEQESANKKMKKMLLVWGVVFFFLCTYSEHAPKCDEAGTEAGLFKFQLCNLTHPSCQTSVESIFNQFSFP